MAKIRSKRHDALVLYPHHRKPFRVHHLATLLVSLALVLGCVFEFGYLAGHYHGAAKAPAPAAAKPAPPGSTAVRSGYGFSLTAPADVFVVTGTDSGGQAAAVTGPALKTGRPLTEVMVQARPGAVSGRLAAARLSVRVNPDASALTAARAQPANKGLSPERVAAAMFPVSAGSEVSAKRISSAEDRLNGVPVIRGVYEFTALSGGKSYTVIWSGAVKGRAFSVELAGLAGSAAIPGEFAGVLATLDISAGQAVLGAESVFAAPEVPKGKLDAKYLSDALSPAVVQIFHTVCGALTVNGNALGDSDCVSFSGSGFLATSSGYIATNGHVVVYSAKDALADIVVSNDDVLHAYLEGLGLSEARINAIKSDPAALAALISKIYDLPGNAVRFSGESELTLVALGTDQPDIKKLLAVRRGPGLAAFKHDTDTIKQAAIVGYDYNAKDSFTTVADPKTGFTSSDVALLKVDVSGAPAIPVETGRVVQNEKIVVMGFPGDADNALTDNRQAAVTVTDGVVSSIREAAGGNGRLYQSDADASHGSSGGPAVDEEGRVIGLLTYRYAGNTDGDAAKSYIRDIADLTRLARDRGVTLDSRSDTQDAWVEGLELYSANHYSAALKDFNRVTAAYPAQRLVSSYIASSRDAIAAGKDVPDVPVNLLLIVLAAGLVAAGTAAAVMVRHHALHRVYRTSVPDAANHQPVYIARTHPPKPTAR